jgi:hypothetical protein
VRHRHVTWARNIYLVDVRIPMKSEDVHVLEEMDVGRD